MQYDELTIEEAQRMQPWSVPYGRGKWWVTNSEGQLKHAILHAQKTLGKIADEVEALDHVEGWLSDEALRRVANGAADLLSAALRIGNVVGYSVAARLIGRVRAKNGFGYGDVQAQSAGAGFSLTIIDTRE